ncbi:hypothetical protein RIR_jg13102.t1 [Rhizophagus irregularis DAOM 181602=DAOM 197198]|nr:hypothetical protein RIR_jg13102.t1 [Rhizophagus irregularis DAOM 181602=DAOM 197198]
MDTYIDNHFNNTTYSSSRTFEKNLQKFRVFISLRSFRKRDYRKYFIKAQISCNNTGFAQFSRNSSMNCATSCSVQYSVKGLLLKPRSFTMRNNYQADLKKYSAFPKNESDSEDHERKYRQNSPQKKQCTEPIADAENNPYLTIYSDADHDDKIEHSGTHRVGKACDFLCWNYPARYSLTEDSITAECSEELLLSYKLSSCGSHLVVKSYIVSAYPEMQVFSLVPSKDYLTPYTEEAHINDRDFTRI